MTVDQDASLWRTSYSDLEDVAPPHPYPLFLPEPWDGLKGWKERLKEPRTPHEIKEGRAPEKGKVDVYMGCRKPTAG